jgi:NTP pyrophosphatase (non-canonical NTP hydrolase)
MKQLVDAIFVEIKRGNEKHGHGPLATPEQVALVLVEEIGEYAQAVMQQRPDDARKELVQVAAVAFNHLLGTGPHFSSK